MKHFPIFLLVLGIATQALLAAAPPVTNQDVERIIAAAAKFDEGQPNAPLLALEQLVNQTHGNTRLRARLEKQLAAMLGTSASLAAKQFACRQLWLIGTDSSVPTLAKLLANQDTHVAEAACFALSKHPAPMVDKVLREALTNTHGKALLAVINLIAERRDARSVPSLAKLCHSPDVEAASAATAALGKIASPEAIKTLETLRADAANHARLQAAQQLAARGKAGEADKLYRQLADASLPFVIRRGALVGRIRLGGPDALPLVLATLDGAETALKPAAIACVSSLKAGNATAELAGKLPRLPADLQAMLIEALVDRNDPQVRPVLVQATGHADGTVRLAALKGLGTVGDASAVPLLIGHLATDEAAAWSLRALKAGGADQAILAGLNSTQGAMRAKLIGILVDRRCPGLATEIFMDLANPDEAVAHAAWRAFGVVGTPADVPALTKKLMAVTNDGTRATAESAVAQLAGASPEPGRSEPVCAALASAHDPTVRTSLLRVLGRIADDQALAAVAGAGQTDPDAVVRVLASWPNARAWEPLMDFVKNSSNRTHQILAFNGCVRLLQNEPSMERYARMAGFAIRPEEVRVLLSALAEVPKPEALQMAAGYLENAAVRNEAALAAIAIAKGLRGGNRKLVTTTMQRILALVNTADLRQQAQQLLNSPPSKQRAPTPKK